MQRIYLPARKSELAAILSTEIPAGRPCAFADEPVAAACEGLEGNDEEVAEVASHLAALSATAMDLPSPDGVGGGLAEVVLAADLPLRQLVQRADPEPEQGRFSGTYVTEQSIAASDVACIFDIERTDTEQPDLLWYAVDELDAIVP